MERIEFSRALVLGSELGAIEDAIDRGHLAGDGHYTALCSAELERLTGSFRALLTPSCSAALEISTKLAGISAGDEVILPSFNFPSAANAIVSCGGIPIFVDIRPDTLNIDEACIEDAVTDRTRAVIVVHYAGVACGMDTIGEIVARHGLVLIEDAAHAIGAACDDQALGAIGHLGTFSFHATKNLNCGEGGALLVNDPTFIERAEVIREKGTDRKKFMRGEIDKYSWVGLGSSHLMPEINAAFLWEQLRHREEILVRRCERWSRYHTAFAELESSGRARRPQPPPRARHNGHIYYLLLAGADTRDGLRQHLDSRGIQATSHYTPLHSSIAGKHFGRSVGQLTNTDRVAASILRLPMHDVLTEPQQDRVIAAVWDFFRTPTAHQ